MQALIDLRAKIASTIMEREKDPTFEISKIFSHFSKAIESGFSRAVPTPDCCELRQIKRYSPCVIVRSTEQQDACIEELRRASLESECHHESYSRR